jgi:hypothetical protein
MCVRLRERATRMLAPRACSSRADKTLYAWTKQHNYASNPSPHLWATVLGILSPVTNSLSSLFKNQHKVCAGAAIVAAQHSAKFQRRVLGDTLFLMSCWSQSAPACHEEARTP